MFISDLRVDTKKEIFIMSKEITKKIKLGILSLSALGLLAACADDTGVDDPATDPAVEDPAVTDPAEEGVEDPATDPVEEEDAGDDTENGV